jgi:hypothetical protein
MQSDSLTVYRCKQCAASFRRRDELQPHLYWHHITDKQVDLYFVHGIESHDAAAASVAAAPVDAPARKSEPSFAVLGVCLAILGGLGLAYYLAN